MITDVLTQPGRFEPLTADHPGVGIICEGCGHPLLAGDRPALVNAVPADEEEQALADMGRAHTVATVLAHETCAWPGGSE